MSRVTSTWILLLTVEGLGKAAAAKGCTRGHRSAVGAPVSRRGRVRDGWRRWEENKVRVLG